jgi:hypothetical protein
MMKTTATIIFILTISVSVTLRSHAQSAVAAPDVKAAIDGVLGLFQQRPVVVLCDDHGLAEEEVFYSLLVRDPRFAATVGNVVVEFGGEAYQGTIDRYVAGEDVPIEELRRVWTETPGWVPGPTRIGYINFFANVRAANLQLAPERRIKVWLGEPKIDWAKIKTFQDLQPYLGQRDDNYFRIIRDEILQKHKKTLLIIGTGHIFGTAPLGKKFDQAYPNTLATVVPFTGYIEDDCNAKFVQRAKSWPVPATVRPVAGTWLKAVLQSPDCSFLDAETITQIKGTPIDKLPGNFSSAAELLHAYSSAVSGEDADALLYLGPPDALTESAVDPAIYLDPNYFKEEDRRLSCCTTPRLRGRLDWDRILQQNAVVPRMRRPGSHCSQWAACPSVTSHGSSSK